MNFMDSNEELTVNLHEVHIHVQRKGRKVITIVSGLERICDINIACKNLKKKLCCGVTIRNTSITNNTSTMIELMGDHSLQIQSFLLDSKLVTQSQIKLHGV